MKRHALADERRASHMPTQAERVAYAQGAAAERARMRKISMTVAAEMYGDDHMCWPIGIVAMLGRMTP